MYSFLLAEWCFSYFVQWESTNPFYLYMSEIFLFHCDSWRIVYLGIKLYINSFPSSFENVSFLICFHWWKVHDQPTYLSFVKKKKKNPSFFFRKFFHLLFCNFTIMYLAISLFLFMLLGTCSVSSVWGLLFPQLWNFLNLYLFKYYFSAKPRVSFVWYFFILESPI